MTEEFSKDTSGFYDELAADYDEMTGFEKRFISQEPVFRTIVSSYGIKTALDAGCGTGFHSLLLSRLGVSVTAVDISGEMLAALMRHASDFGLSVETVKASFQELALKLQAKFGALFCLGNSLVHLSSGDALRLALRNFHCVLEPGGILFIQNLNYDRVMKNRTRIQSIKSSGTKTYVRFYDFREKSITFNILTIEDKSGTILHSLNSTELRPLLKNDLTELLGETGFRDIQAYGSLAREEYSVEDSQDLVLISRK